MIWRRLLVSSETTIAQLYQYIQVAFNWSGRLTSVPHPWQGLRDWLSRRHSASLTTRMEKQLESIKWYLWNGNTFRP
jgi:hypothetical protein